MIYVVNQWAHLNWGWSKDYVDGISEVLTEREIEHKIVSNEYENELMKYLIGVPKDSIVWLMSYETDIAKAIRNIRPDLFLIAHAHGTKTMLFEPSYLHGGQVFIKPAYEIEKEYLSLYNLVFCNSQWQFVHMPTDNIRITGFPVPMGKIQRMYRACATGLRKEKKVLISQRFSFEKNLPFAIMLAKELTQFDYEVVWCYGRKTGDFELMSEYVKQAEYAGVEFKYCPNKMMYYEEMLTSGYVLTTSAYDTLSLSMVEGYLAGCKVISPNNMCFPEYMLKENMYDAYSIDHCIEVLHSARFGVESEELFNNKIVVDKMLRAIIGKGGIL